MIKKSRNPRETRLFTAALLALALGCESREDSLPFVHSDTDTSAAWDTNDAIDTQTEQETDLVDTSDTNPIVDTESDSRGDTGTEQNEIPDQLPDPDNTPPSETKPVKVYILSGQSNMVGIGQVSASSERYSGYYVSASPDAEEGLTVSVYSGDYNPFTDYDSLTAAKVERSLFGGTEGTWPSISGPHTDVARGYFEAPATGKYKFSPGYGDSTFNVMEIEGEEVFRKNTGEQISFQKSVDVVAGQRYGVKITYFKQGSSAGWIVKQGIPGTLETLTEQAGQFPHLKDNNGNWTVRNDVWYKGVVTATANKWLSVGCGSGSDKIGPELQFGHIMGYYHDEPVLIIKASQGNRSLAWDILPPGSERYVVDGVTYAGYGDKDPSWSDEDPYTEVDWYAGKQYDDFVNEIHDVLDNFATLFPDWAGQGYEIAGFAWFQGHKDTGNAVHADRYEFNLVNLINAYRGEFSVPGVPFVIATIGFDGWEMSGDTLKVANAQRAVSGESGNYPDFARNVLTVETRDFWRDASLSPKNQGYHYNQNAETYMLVGDAVGRGMVNLLQSK